MTETHWRLIIFAGVFLTFAGLELAAPKRRAALSRRARWPGAMVLLVAGSVAGRLILPAGLAGLAIWADGAGFGLFNALDLPVWLVVLGSLLLLDLAVWAQHVAMHFIPPLWRLHRVHHSDPHVDVTTALRFHPLEILVSLAWKGAVVVVFGVPAMAAFWFEVILNGFAQFNHANLALPRPADRWLRYLVVTPDMHRVHHSTEPRETNRNFGFCLSVWDRLFRLYRAEPEAGHAAMTLGQPDWRGERDQGPVALLGQPMRAPSQSSAGVSAAGS